MVPQLYLRYAVSAVDSLRSRSSIRHRIQVYGELMLYL